MRTQKARLHCCNIHAAVPADHDIRSCPRALRATTPTDHGYCRRSGNNPDSTLEIESQQLLEPGKTFPETPEPRTVTEHRRKPVQDSGSCREWGAIVAVATHREGESDSASCHLTLSNSEVENDEIRSGSEQASRSRPVNTFSREVSKIHLFQSRET